MLVQWDQEEQRVGRIRRVHPLLMDFGSWRDVQGQAEWGVGREMHKAPRPLLGAAL